MQWAGARALASSGSGGSASGSGGHGQLDPCEDNEDLVPTEEPCETAKSWICKETLAFEALKTTGVEIAPHVGAEAERTALLDGKLRNLTPQARATGFG